jgi:hypothetical protein
MDKELNKEKVSVLNLWVNTAKKVEWWYVLRRYDQSFKQLMEALFEYNRVTQECKEELDKLKQPIDISTNWTSELTEELRSHFYAAYNYLVKFYGELDKAKKIGQTNSQAKSAALKLIEEIDQSLEKSIQKLNRNSTATSKIESEKSESTFSFSIKKVNNNPSNEKWYSNEEFLVISSVKEYLKGQVLYLPFSNELKKILGAELEQGGNYFVQQTIKDCLREYMRVSNALLSTDFEDEEIENDIEVSKVLQNVIHEEFEILTRTKNSDL